PAIAPEFAWRSAHRRLLFDLAVAAPYRETGMRGQARELVFRLGVDVRGEIGILDRIIHVGEHEILPYQDAKFITHTIKKIAFIYHGAADPQHVRARFPGEA